MTKYGKCTNFGNCSIADRGRVEEIPETANFVCPECGRQLIEKTFPHPNFGYLIKIGAALGLIAIIVMAGYGAIWYFWRRPPPIPKFETKLRLHGSNTIGAKLAPALVEKFLELEGAS